MIRGGCVTEVPAPLSVVPALCDWTAGCASILVTGGAATRNTSIAKKAIGSPSRNHSPRHRNVTRHCTNISDQTRVGTYLYAPQCGATGTTIAAAARRGESPISAKNKIRAGLALRA